MKDIVEKFLSEFDSQLRSAVALGRQDPEEAEIWLETIRLARLGLDVENGVIGNAGPNTYDQLTGKSQKIQEIQETGDINE